MGRVIMGWGISGTGGAAARRAASAEVVVGRRSQPDQVRGVRHGVVEEVLLGRHAPVRGRARGPIGCSGGVRQINL